MAHFYTTRQVKFPYTHDFTKCYSTTKINQIVNKCLNGLIITSQQFLILGSVKIMFTKLLLDKELEDAGFLR